MPVKAAREFEPEIERPSADDFPDLEAKIYKAIELLKAAKAGKAAAERDLQRLRHQLEEREEELDSLRSEVVSLRKDRKCSNRLMLWWQRAETFYRYGTTSRPHCSLRSFWPASMVRNPPRILKIGHSLGPAVKISLDPDSIRTIINPSGLSFEGAHFGEPNQRRTGAYPG